MWIWRSLQTGDLWKIIYKNTDEIDIYDRESWQFKGLKHIYEKYTNEKKRLETKVGWDVQFSTFFMSYFNEFNVVYDNIFRPFG